jgi:hypothetical protein
VRFRKDSHVFATRSCVTRRCRQLMHDTGLRATRRSCVPHCNSHSFVYLQASVLRRPRPRALAPLLLLAPGCEAGDGAREPAHPQAHTHAMYSRFIFVGSCLLAVFTRFVFTSEIGSTSETCSMSRTAANLQRSPLIHACRMCWQAPLAASIDVTHTMNIHIHTHVTGLLVCCDRWLVRRGHAGFGYGAADVAGGLEHASSRTH